MAYHRREGMRDSPDDADPLRGLREEGVAEIDAIDRDTVGVRLLHGMPCRRIVAMPLRSVGMEPSPPVLIIAFNRTDTLSRVVEALAPLAPSRMYVAADGPREDRAGEAARCEEVRRMLTALPWRCEIRSRFLDANAGCAHGVAGAVSWFFEQEPSGIVLEDDCVPDPSFLPYCAEMLARHADDDRVMLVLGTRFAAAVPWQTASYSYSRFFSAWGWASWRRAWRRYELALGDWRSKCRGAGQPVPDLPAASNSGWSRKLDQVAASEPPQTWDYQWSFAHFRHDGLAVLPKSNLVSNVGAGPDATHTRRGSIWLELPRASLEHPLVHPERIEPDEAADRHHETWHLNHRPWLARKWWQFRNRHGIGSVESRRGVRDYARSSASRD